MRNDDFKRRRKPILKEELHWLIVILIFIASIVVLPLSLYLIAALIHRGR